MDADDDVGGEMHSEGGGGRAQPSLKGRPSGSKVAKEDVRSASAREGAIYTQPDATKSMAVAQMKKATLLEDQNMLMLMTIPNDQVTTMETMEYLRLRRGDELKKIWRKLTVEEACDLVEAAHLLLEIVSGRAQHGHNNDKDWVRVAQRKEDECGRVQ